MKQVLKITYNGPLSPEIDERIAGLVEFPPLNFNWVGQGYDMKKDIRDISFERVIEN